MSRGRHAAPKKHGPAVAAARTALVRTGACTLGLGLGWTAVTALAGQGYLEAFAAGNQATSTGAGIAAAVQPPAEKPLSENQVRRITALNEEFECSPDGLEPGVVPARAVVRVDREVRVTSFDEGWAMHLGEARGTLVSVCAR